MPYKNLDPIIQAVVRNYESYYDWNRAMQYGEEEFYAEFGEAWTHSEYSFIRDTAHEHYEEFSMTHF